MAVSFSNEAVKILVRKNHSVKISIDSENLLRKYVPFATKSVTKENFPCLLHLTRSLLIFYVKFESYTLLKMQTEKSYE